MKSDSLTKLVSDIIEQIDYDLWKEIYLYEDEPYVLVVYGENEEFNLDNQVRDLIETWYENETSTDKD